MLWKFKHVYQTSLNMARLKNKSKTMLKSMAYHHPNWVHVVAAESKDFLYLEHINIYNLYNPKNPDPSLE